KGPRRWVHCDGCVVSDDADEAIDGTDARARSDRHDHVDDGRKLSGRRLDRPFRHRHHILGNRLRDHQPLPARPVLVARCDLRRGRMAVDDDRDDADGRGRPVRVGPRHDDTGSDPCLAPRLRRGAGRRLRLARRQTKVDRGLLALNCDSSPRRNRAMAKRSAAPGWAGKYDKQIALVLQGGGALGSYQAGVYEALVEHDYVPDWVAGISIGAINSAIIAGNAPHDRVAKLREFWEQVSSPSANWFDLPYGLWQEAMRRTAAMSALMFGQPGFFRPNMLRCWVTGTTPTSYYDTSHLRDTLERLVDFDRINAGETRLSVGAVNVATGNFAYFD